MPRIFKLESDKHRNVRHFLADRVDARQLAGEQPTAVVTITRTGTFTDPRYGEFSITREMLLSMVKNFDGNVYGQKIVLDLAHRPQDGAAGFFKRLFLDGNKLRGEVQFTEYGAEAVRKRGFIYLSAEFADNYVDNEQRKEHGPTLLGAALTPRPVIKRLDPVQLAEDTLTTSPTYLSDRISKLLQEDMAMTLAELLDELRKKLSKFNLAEMIVSQLVDMYKTVAGQLADETVQRTLLATFVTQGELMAKQMAGAGSQAVTLDLSPLIAAVKQLGAGLSADDVKKLLADERAAEETRRKQLQESRDKNVVLFKKLLDESEGLKSLAAEQRANLDAAADMITSDMTEDQVRRLAEHQIRVGNDLVVATRLSQMGFSVQGQVQIPSGGELNQIYSLQEEINKALRGTSHHAVGELRLPEREKLNGFVARVLAEFDRLNAPRLHAEAKSFKQLADTTGMANTNLPLGFQRTVIQEALSDLRVLTLIQTLTDPSATATTQIPYEQRDVSAVLNDGIVYEGGPIHRAGISQEMDLAYIVPMKLAFLISNEVMHFTRASAINWDAYARNVASNARFMRELIVRRICNELQRSADAYGAVAVADEAFDTQLDGATSRIKTSAYPIVRPYQVRDLKGTAVGNPENPITLTLNGTVISPYDGSGEQAAGTYYRVSNYNLGYIDLVDETGALVTPADTGVNTISYSRASNVTFFDLDNGTVELDVYLNGLLNAVGDAKAMMNQDRFVLPDFQLMSATLNNTASKARAFEAQAKRAGTGTTNDGDLDMIKGIPSFATNAPAVDLGDERILLGQRGTLTYTVAKPFVTGDPVEAVDANGKLIGKKQAYGEEYSAIKVPVPIRNRLTSVIAYSSSGR